MADRIIETPHGFIEIPIDLTKAKDGNKALKEASEKAASQAKAQKRTLGEGYGTRREGQMLTIVFPLKA